VFCPLKKKIVTLTEIDPEKVKQQCLDTNNIEELTPRLLEELTLANLIEKLHRLDNLDFLGAPLAPDLALKICSGELNPATL